MTKVYGPASSGRLATAAVDVDVDAALAGQLQIAAALAPEGQVELGLNEQLEGFLTLLEAAS
ncbi:MAG: hypothetical protein NTU93_01280 [Arthrobacter sp.]|nr:hypothetical protein [Arthrobacter sp.]